MLIHHVIPFIRNPENVLSTTETTILHDLASCMSALATQNLLKENEEDFFGNNEWPGSFPDLNPCENLGAIVKDRGEQCVQNAKNELIFALTSVLEGMEFDHICLCLCWESYPARFEAVRLANCVHAKY